MPVPQGAIEAISDAAEVCVLTGAGASADSGVPTFRDAQTGIWAKFEPTELATPEAFQRNPELVWGWYSWRREQLEKVEPNAGHRALVSLARKVPSMSLITQNVDGLHQRAGSSEVIEYHGNIFSNRCFGSDCDIGAVRIGKQLPSCPHCGSFIRPGVVWFGEAIPGSALESSAAAAQRCDVFLSVGTSAIVWPAAGLAETARQNGAKIIEVNPDTTALSPHCDYAIAARSAEILPAIVAAL